MQKIPVSVEILTHNSAATVRRALESVKDFEEILIIDGSSTDETRTIAHEYGARVIDQDKRHLNQDGRVKDFAGVRNQGLTESTQKWFLFLDSDEYLSSEIVKEIRDITFSHDSGAFWVLRKYIANDAVVECATTYPNKSMRFFSRDKVRRFIKEVHERIQLQEGVVPQTLLSPLLVPIENDVRRNWPKDARYIALEVERCQSLPRGELIIVSFKTILVSVRYFFRLCKIVLLCRGKHMPLSHELDRHWYHAKLLWALWKSRI